MTLGRGDLKVGTFKGTQKLFAPGSVQRVLLPGLVCYVVAGFQQQLWGDHGEGWHRQQSHLQNSSMISGKLTNNNRQNHQRQHGWEPWPNLVPPSQPPLVETVETVNFDVAFVWEIAKTTVNT